jgi:hypothetical protein
LSKEKDRLIEKRQKDKKEDARESFWYFLNQNEINSLDLHHFIEKKRNSW